jgi:hypothetical protein
MLLGERPTMIEFFDAVISDFLASRRAVVAARSLGTVCLAREFLPRPVIPGGTD